MVQGIPRITHCRIQHEVELLANRFMDDAIHTSPGEGVIFRAETARIGENDAQNARFAGNQTARDAIDPIFQSLCRLKDSGTSRRANADRLTPAPVQDRGNRRGRGSG